MSVKKKLFSAALAAGLVFGISNISNATNGYYMIATGAKSLGMAGAVVANPQDASTIIQNPAGIAWLPNTMFDVGGSLFMPPRKLNGHKSDSNLFVVPAAGFAYNPMGCNCGTPHFVFGIGMYGVSGMGVDWSDNNLTGDQKVPVMTPLGPVNVKTGWLKKAYSNMQMMEMSIGGAYRTGNFSIGFAPVFVYQALSMEFDWNVPDYKNTLGGGVYTNQQMKLPSPGVHTDSLDTANAYGIGFDLGLVYKINDMLTVGLVYKSKRYMQKLEWNTTPGNGLMITSDKVKMRLDMPRQVAFGIDFRPIEPLRIETDIRWINYKDVMWEPKVSGLAIDKWPFHWHNQWVFAVGASYDISKSFTVRAGFNYAKSPIKDEDLNSNIVAPAIVQTHATIGFTYKFTKNFDISMAYAHAFSHKQSVKNTDMQDVMMYGPETSVKMHQDTVAFELSYVF
ncbi:OmpP1/FadL family transporter [Hippea alviniae]|uniref:OmpP1/FadL family transporter n=1 Tax=Hippea alviniae TaxID=1279027 RepID=UPI0003B55F8F|nr:outer membrane protein transport protein [Hippea alviniae]